MSQPTGHECARPPSSRRRASRKVALLGALLLVTAHCTFPEYDNRDAPLGQAGSDAGTGATSAGSGGAAPSGQSGAEPSAGGSNEAGVTSVAGAAGLSGEGGEGGCSGEQWPLTECQGACLIRYPDHCYDSEQSGDEPALDCGGSCQPCVVEPCSEASDCLSGVCAPGPDGATCESPLTLSHEAHEKANNVGSTAWSVTLRSSVDGGQAFVLRDLKIRYYFDRNGVVEPIMLRATRSHLLLVSGENRDLPGTRWTVVRVEDVPAAAYNAYVEVSFDEGGQLFPGDQIVLHEQMLSGDPGISTFDQGANYSFSETNGPSERISVLYRGQLVWGLEPRPVNPRACFAKGINLNGPALTVAGNAWLAASQAGVTSSGTGISQGGPFHPPVTGATASVLATAYRLDAGDTLEVPVDNGVYLLYLYAGSPGIDAVSSALTVDGISAANSSKFRSQAIDGGLAWARLGPYRTDVLTGQITVAVTTGSINLAGLELWYPQ